LIVAQERRSVAHLKWVAWLIVTTVHILYTADTGKGQEVHVSDCRAAVGNERMFGMDITFRIRYRALDTDGDCPALVVEDADGLLYLFSGGQLQMWFHPRVGWPRLRTALARTGYQWESCDNDVFYTLTALTGLTSPAHISQPLDMVLHIK
jgi:hypothetical protein